MSANKQLWVYLPLEAEALLPEGWELLATAQALLAGRTDFTLAAVLYGARPQAAAEDLAEQGLTVYACACPPEFLADYRLQATALQRLAEEFLPAILLFPSDAENGILAATLGQKLQTGVICHCVSASLSEDGLLYGLIPAYGGAYMGEIICPRHSPQIATLKTQPLDFQPLDGTGRVINFAAPTDTPSGLTLLGLTRETTATENLQNAEVIVCGGAGVGSAENWQQLTLLAQRLHAAVGCTRPPLDADWGASESMMIGTSGKTVRPKVYVGFGISGMAHHVCGMQDSGLILNINTDDKALACQSSDFAYIGDAADIVERLLHILG